MAKMIHKCSTSWRSDTNLWTV